MLIPQLKSKALEFMKAKDSVGTSIVRLALGEIQTTEARSNKTLTDEEGFAVIRKLIKSNEETLGNSSDDSQKEILKKEIAILSAFLPASMTPEQIAAALAPVTDAVKAAPNDGAAVGVAMKHLKSQGAAAQGSDVSKAVKLIRG